MSHTQHQPTADTVRYVVAADGGNSKTDIILATVEGEVLAVVRGAGTHPDVDGMTLTARTLADLTKEAVAKARLAPTTRLSVGTFHLANVDLPDDEQRAHVELRRLDIAQTVRVRNDTFAVLRAGAERGWGVAVVAGAGINAVGIRPDGGEERFLALGETTGDWGGGDDVGVAALGAAVRAGDGRGPHTSLRKLIEERFGSDPEAIAVGLNRREIDEGCLHALAPVVFGAASDGDLVARRIVLKLAEETVCYAETLLRRMALLDSDADVVLGGGMLQSGNGVLLDRIRELLLAVAPNIALRVLDAPPVIGALLAALDLAGASAHAQTRARTIGPPG